MRRGTVFLATALAFAIVRASDIDGDGHFDGADCDDREASVWALPGEPGNLRFVSKTTFVWDAAADLGATGSTYVTVRSTSPSNFGASPQASCNDPEGLAASTTDPTVPPAGTAFFYLVRARNACGDGLLGRRSNGIPVAGLTCDCAVLCDDAQACTRDRCADGVCAHEPIATAIEDQPDDAAVCAGGSATFRVRGVPDGATPHYQWRKNGTNVGTDGPTLTLTGLAVADDDAQVTVVVTGACAPATSAAARITVFSSASSCAGGDGYEAPNGASDVVRLGDPDEPSGASSRDYGSVHLATGDFHLEDADLVLRGRGFDVVWTRSYRSRTGALTAMGPNWDFSYNRWIAASSGGITLHAGDGRADVYTPGTTGCWTSPGFFRDLCPQPDGTWVLTFPDRRTWRFSSLDGSPGGGRIVAEQDADGNTMGFSYDTTGKLQTITDTLGRPITVAYDTAGWIASVTDFTGRHVAYGRYGALDQAGMPGDLASVTSPSITGTPNGNDLPEGRTTYYTYTAYTGQPALDHNLVTVSRKYGPKPEVGPVRIVENVYNDADRLAKQVYGDDPFTSIAYVYAAALPGDEPAATTRTIVRDRDGNVGEVFSDASNRVVAVRRYTGRAPNPARPTDATTNRPVAPLRATDPPFYRTALAWSSDSLLTEVTFPKLDAVQLTYDSSNTNMRLRANLLELRRLAGPAGGDQPLLQEQWTYAPGWGTDRWISYTDPNGRTTTRTIDPATGHVMSRTAPAVTIGLPPGSAQSISESWTYNAFGQPVTYTDPLGHVASATYYASGPSMAYLESVTVDAPVGTPGALSLLTITARDAYGNVTALTDPNGNTQTFTYNALDELVRHVTPAPSSYTTDYRYDGGGRLVRIDRDNRDETGAFRARPKIFTVIGLDPLDRPTSFTVDGPGALDPEGGLNLKTEVTLAHNGWATLVRRRNAVGGSQPHETTRILYDELSRAYRIVDAESDPAQSTTQLDYDLDGGVATIREGLESSARVTSIARDGYGRKTQVTDPMGNVATWHYDANGNVVSRRIDGELIDGFSGANARLSEAAMLYDEIDRLVRTDTAFFDTATGTDILDGTATRKYFHDERSQLVRAEDDEGHGPILSYDGAGRLVSAHDPVGNAIAYGYDANGNVVTVTATDVSDDATVPPRITVTTNTYDELGSLLTTSRAGEVHSFAWDTMRDLPAVAHDGRSNRVRYAHDDAGRLVAEQRTMTDTGTGSGNVTFVLDATRSHDDEGRITSQTDENGNTTGYAYDAKGRLTSITYADGTSETYGYDVHDDAISWTDPNGTVVSSTFDALGRLSTRSIARAPWVLGSTSEIWRYDGLSRVVHAQNDDALVTRGYDSLSQLTRETSAIGADGGKNVNWLFTGSGALLSLGYPSGHNWAMEHDSAGQYQSMTLSGPGLPPVVTTYDYLGLGRVVRRGNGNGTETRVTYDDALRPNRITTQVPGGAVLDDRTLLWDADSNKTSRQLLSSPGAGSRHLYTYDSASRMTGSNLFVPGQAPVQVDYALDGMGNRLAVTGGPDAGAYVMSSSLPSPADHQMNQYTSTPLDGARAYDAAGNLVSRTSGASALAYDYRGRLVLVSGSSGSGSYAYDAFGRRVLVDGDRLYYDGMREIEQHSSSGSLERLNVYGPASEILMSVADVDLDGLPDRLHQQTDDLGNVVLVTGPVGEALERYDYGDFGQPRIMNAAGAPLAQSAIGNPFLFGGRRYDGATGLYDAVTRHLDPRAGVFVSRDTLGVWGDPASRGHATAYAAGNPWSCLDPTGRAIENRQTLKTYFETGDVPTQDQFYDARTPLKDRFQDGDIPNQDDFADTLIARPVLKSFFQTGDKPTQAQFGALIDSALNRIDDRDLLGLRVTRPVLKSFFQTGDKPTQAQFADTIDSFYYMFEDRDVPELRLLPRTILKSFFQTGDKPTQAQFADTIDSFYYMFEDRDGLELRLLPRTILKSFFQTGDKPTQAQFGALIDSVLHLQTFRWTQVSGPYRFSTRSGE